MLSVITLIHIEEGDAFMTYGKKEKVCATCIYWDGRRNVEFSFIEAKNYEGTCASEEAFFNMKTVQGSSCSNWKGFPGQKER
jgi:hypothetical protein